MTQDAAAILFLRCFSAFIIFTEYRIELFSKWHLKSWLPFRLSVVSTSAIEWMVHVMVLFLITKDLLRSHTAIAVAASTPRVTSGKKLRREIDPTYFLLFRLYDSRMGHVVYRIYGRLWRCTTLTASHSLKNSIRLWGVDLAWWHWIDLPFWAPVEDSKVDEQRTLQSSLWNYKFTWAVARFW